MELNHGGAVESQHSVLLEPDTTPRDITFQSGEIAFIPGLKKNNIIAARSPALISRRTSWSSSYAPNSDTNNNDDSEIVEVVDSLPAASPDQDISLDVHSECENKSSGIELQRCQSAKDSEIVEVVDSSPAASPDQDISLDVHSECENKSSGIELQRCQSAKDSEIVEVEDSLPAASPDQDVSLHVHSPCENEIIGIELQPYQIANAAKIVKEKKLDSLHDIGGVKGVAEALHTDLDNGIPGDTEDICRRKTTTLSKTQVPAKSFLHFPLEACNNYTIFLLILTAVLSLAFGIKEQGIKNGWFDGVLIILTIFVLVIFRTIHNYLLERSRKKNSSEDQKLSNRELLRVGVIRRGSHQLISANDLVPGDIAHLWEGSLVPADGLFVAGEVLELDDGSRSFINEQNPFLFYGARVIKGEAWMLVTSVGMEGTAWSEMMSKATNSPQKKRTIDACLDRVTTCTHMFGLVISILIILVLFLRFSCGKIDEENGNRDTSKGEPTAIKMFINAINIIIIEPKGTARVLTTLLSLSLVGITDGIPFVLTLAIIHWNQKTLSDKASARDLLACVTMGSVTTICTDKIGGLTENHIEVEKFLIGEEVISESSVISPDVLEGLSDGIGMSVSSTGDPLFSWGQEKLGMQRETLEQLCIIVEHKGLNPYEEQCRVLMEKNGNNGKERSLHLKGPAAIVLANCSLYYDRRGQKQDIDNHKRGVLDQAIKDMLAKHLKVIAFACKLATDATTLEANDLTLLGLLGLKNTCLEDTRKAAATSTAAGLKTILVSGDDVTLLQRIAGECHLLTPDSDAVVLSGEDFRNFTDEERMEKVDRIRIMGNSLLSDKLLLVQCLRNKGELVAMVGQRTNDAPAMKEADIGIAMGTWSSEKAREISDIIVWDGNYSFLIDMIKFGRCFHENIRKFIQLQLIMIIAEISINFLGTTILGDAPMTVIQLFWVNLVVGILGGLAILTEQPNEKPMKEKGRELLKKPLINKPMWRNMVSQASYQVAVSVTLQHKGKYVLGTSEKVIKSIIFYSFILCQVFNHFNARELEEKNFFKGIFQNLRFWVCFGLFTVLQIAYVLIEPIVVGTAKLNWKLWAGCFVIGLGTWGIDWTVKYASGFIKKDWFTVWKIDSDFVRKGWFTRLPCLRIESVSTTPSVPPESASNLHHLSEEEEEITALPV